MSCGCGSFNILSLERATARPPESCCGKTINDALGALLISVTVPEVMLALKETVPLQLIRTLWNWCSLAHHSLVIAGLRNGIWKKIPPHKDERSHVSASSFVFSMFPLVCLLGWLLFCLLTFGES